MYPAWAQEVNEAAPAAPLKAGKKADPKLQARSDDGGRHFGEPVRVNPAEDDVRSRTVHVRVARPETES